MREILFRGRGLYCDYWFEGYYVRLYDHKGNVSHQIYPGYAETDCGDFYPDWDEVDPKTVGQYTGRIDKNGKKVFENDIVQLFTIWEDGTIEKGLVCAVQWLTNDQCYVLTRGGSIVDDFGNYGSPEYYEVIGNVHDNPELLGRAENG